MTCLPIPGGVICGAGPHPTARRIVPCPTENRRRRMVQTYGGLWYGDTLTCLGCGDSWSAGGRHGRPFTRGWRRREIARAHRKWATAGSRAGLAARLRADLAAEAA